MVHDHHDHGHHDHAHHDHGHHRHAHNQQTTPVDGAADRGMDSPAKAIERPTPMVTRNVETFPSLMRMGVPARLALASGAIVLIWIAAFMVMG